MKVLQAVPMITEDARFGGPSSVAIMQATALAERGHDVTLLAGGERRQVTHDHGFELVTMPLRRLPLYGGLAGSLSPGTLEWFRRNWKAFDVLHLHAGRDLISLPLAKLAMNVRIPYFIQSHGMIGQDYRFRSRIADKLVTRLALANAQVAFSLTENEDAALKAVSPESRIRRLLNAVPDQEMTASYQTKSPLVVFIARFHERKGGENFLRAAALLRDRPYAPRFLMTGPDEGQLGTLIRLREDLSLTPICTIQGSTPPAEVLKTLSSSCALALPSRDEPFPMSVLEAMSVGLPVVITSTNGLAPYLREAGLQAAVGDGTPEDLAERLDAILSSATVWQHHSRIARTTARTTFSAQSVARDLERYYEAGLVVDAS